MVWGFIVVSCTLKTCLFTLLDFNLRTVFTMAVGLAMAGPELDMFQDFLFVLTLSRGL